MLFTGEGSHQLSANDVGTMGRNGLKPIVFVLNNEGYMVELALTANPDWVYNDLAPWNYHALPAALGCQGWFTAKVTTVGELDAALARASLGESPCLGLPDTHSLAGLPDTHSLGCQTPTVWRGVSEPV